MDAIFDLVDYIVNTRYEALPLEVVEVAKKFTLDSLGVGLAGSTAPGSQEVVGLLREWGGKPESTVMVYGGKVPAPGATLANSLMIHARDFDDTQDELGTHTLVTVLPSALAVAERAGGRTGKDLITALVLGVDVICKLQKATKPFHGWQSTPVFGTFGAAAAAGKILGLDRERMVNALGIAYSQAAGNRQGRKDGALTKRMQPGLMARDGVLSAILAERGLTGAKNILEGEWGFFRLYRDPDREYDPKACAQALRAGLRGGESEKREFEIMKLSAKPYPCCRAAQASIGAALELASQNGIKSEQIDQVTAYVSQRVFDTVGSPFQIRTDPQVDAQFSIPYTVAVALARGKPTIADFEERAIRDPRILDFVKKVKAAPDAGIKEFPAIEGPMRLEIRMKDGKVYSGGTRVAKGSPQNQMTMAEFMDKFNGCLKYSARPLSRQNVDGLLAIVDRLEALDDISKLTRLLA